MRSVGIAAMAALTLLAVARSSSAEAPAPAAAANKYTMDDLRALSQSQSWPELVEHLEDVRPSERKAEWSGFLEKATTGFLEGLAIQKKQHEAQQSADSFLTRFPALKQSKAFMQKRADVGLAALSECWNERRAGCLDALETFTKADPNDLELAFRAGKLLVEVIHIRPPAATFFARALADKKQRAARCKDPSVLESVLEALGHPPSYDSTKAAVTVAFEDCYAEFKPQLLEGFMKAGFAAKSYCQGFTQNKAPLTAFQAAFCKDQLQ
jgi:hypothetical protein